MPVARKDMPITEAREAIRAATHITAVTGAGISAPTGIPVYRARNSSWIKDGLERRMHKSQYGNHLPEIWEFWGGLRALSQSVQPTLAHSILSDARVDVLTQNIDGLHTRAGSRVIELHGSVMRTACIRCKNAYDDTRIPAKGSIPSCLMCDKVDRTRADVVLFGENLVSRNVKAAAELLKQSDVCLYVGTSGNVFPVADFVRVAKHFGATTILVNKDPWEDVSMFDGVFTGDAAALLPYLFEKSDTLPS